MIFDNKNIVKNGVQRGYAIFHGYKALSGGTGTQVRVSIMSLFLTVLCRFAKGKAAVQTPRSNKRQKGVVVWKLRMDTSPRHMQAQSPTYLCLMELPRSLRGICGDHRGTDSVSVERTDRKGQELSHLCLVPGNQKEPHLLASGRVVALARRAMPGGAPGKVVGLTNRRLPRQGRQQMPSDMSAGVRCGKGHKSPWRYSVSKKINKNKRKE